VTRLCGVVGALIRRAVRRRRASWK
jgi:hypothetical protein